MRTALLVLAGLLTSCAYTITPAERDAYFALRRTPEPSSQGELVCHVHHEATVEFMTRENAGMCLEPRRSHRPYMKARVHLFPNSYWETDSCFCESFGHLAFVRICPKCRAAEREWRRQHRMSMDEPYPLGEAG